MTDTFVINSTTGKATIKKDPVAILDYIWDWTLWLDDIIDTIVSHVITPASPDITVVSSTVVGKTVVAFLSGGVVGKTYQVECKITTTGGRTDERSIYLKIVER